MGSATLKNWAGMVFSAAPLLGHRVGAIFYPRAMKLSPLPQAAPNGKERLDGYWVEDWQDLPATRPPYDPLGNLLIDRAHPNADGTFDALTLVELEGERRPLSRAAVLTYFHTASLAHGDPVHFVNFDADQPEVLDVEPELHDLEPVEAARRFNLSVDLFRADQPALVLKVKPRPANGGQ